MNTSTNSLAFGSLVIRADLRDPEDNQRLVRFFAFVVLTLAAILIFFSNTLFRKLNKALAAVKIAALVVLIGGGIYATNKQENRTFKSISMDQAEHPAVDHFLALFYVLFAFNGWEHATFVLSPFYIGSSVQY